MGNTVSDSNSSTARSSRSEPPFGGDWSAALRQLSASRRETDSAAEQQKGQLSSTAPAETPDADSLGSINSLLRVVTALEPPGRQIQQHVAAGQLFMQLLEHLAAVLVGCQQAAADPNMAWYAAQHGDNLLAVAAALDHVWGAIVRANSRDEPVNVSHVSARKSIEILTKAHNWIDARAQAFAATQRQLQDQLEQHSILQRMAPVLQHLAGALADYVKQQAPSSADQEPAATAVHVGQSCLNIWLMLDSFAAESVSVGGAYPVAAGHAGNAAAAEMVIAAAQVLRFDSKFASPYLPLWLSTAIHVLQHPVLTVNDQQAPALAQHLLRSPGFLQLAVLNLLVACRLAAPTWLAWEHHVQDPDSSGSGSPSPALQSPSQSSISSNSNYSHGKSSGSMNNDGSQYSSTSSHSSRCQLMPDLQCMCGSLLEQLGLPRDVLQDSGLADLSIFSTTQNDASTSAATVAKVSFVRLALAVSAVDKALVAYTQTTDTAGTTDTLSPSQLSALQSVAWQLPGLLLCITASDSWHAAPIEGQGWRSSMLGSAYFAVKCWAIAQPSGTGSAAASCSAAARQEGPSGCEPTLAAAINTGVSDFCSWWYVLCKQQLLDLSQPWQPQCQPEVEQNSGRLHMTTCSNRNGNSSSSSGGISEGSSCTAAAGIGDTSADGIDVSPLYDPNSLSAMQNLLTLFVRASQLPAAATAAAQAAMTQHGRRICKVLDRVVRQVLPLAPHNNHPQRIALDEKLWMVLALVTPMQSQESAPSATAAAADPSLATALLQRKGARQQLLSLLCSLAKFSRLQPQSFLAERAASHCFELLAAGQPMGADIQLALLAWPGLCSIPVSTILTPGAAADSELGQVQRKPAKSAQVSARDSAQARDQVDKSSLVEALQGTTSSGLLLPTISKQDLKAAPPAAAYGFHSLCSTCLLLGQYSSLQAAGLMAQLSDFAVEPHAAVNGVSNVTAAVTSAAAAAASAVSAVAAAVMTVAAAAMRVPGRLAGMGASATAAKKSSFGDPGRSGSSCAQYSNEVVQDMSAQECLAGPLTLQQRHAQVQQLAAQVKADLDAAPSNNLDVSTAKYSTASINLQNLQKMTNILAQVNQQKAVILKQVQQRADRVAILGKGGSSSSSSSSRGSVGPALPAGSTPGPGYDSSSNNNASSSNSGSLVSSSSSSSGSVTGSTDSSTTAGNQSTATSYLLAPPTTLGGSSDAAAAVQASGSAALTGTQGSVRQVSQQDSQLLASLGAAVVSRYFCNNPDCINLSRSSELKLMQQRRLTCSACRLARYCSADCQHAHWRMHRRVCKAGIPPSQSIAEVCAQLEKMRAEQGAK